MQCVVQVCLLLVQELWWCKHTELRLVPIGRKANCLKVYPLCSQLSLNLAFWHHHNLCARANKFALCIANEAPNYRTLAMDAYANPGSRNLLKPQELKLIFQITKNGQMWTKIAIVSNFSYGYWTGQRFVLHPSLPLKLRDLEPPRKLSTAV